MRNWYRQIESWLEDETLVIACLLVLVAVASFGLGRWSVSGDTQAAVAVTPVSRADLHVTPSTPTATELDSGQPTAPQVDSQDLVASRNGTKYHRQDCPGAKQITDANKLFFATVEEAAASGYTPAANCPGL